MSPAAAASGSAGSGSRSGGATARAGRCALRHSPRVSPGGLVARLAPVGVRPRVLLLGALVLARVVSQPGLSAGDAGVAVDPRDVHTVLPRDAIRAIDRPEFVPAHDPAAGMADTERVLGLVVDGDARAYPVNVLSVHEIVNDVVGGRAIAVTW
jgi:hypothetical protein